MEIDLKMEIDKDLKLKMDLLHSMKTLPLHHLSQRFEDTIRSIDHDAEKLILKQRKYLAFLKDTDDSEASSEVIKKVDEARCEFVRILKAVESQLLTRLLSTEPSELGDDFVTLENRVDQFREMSLSQETDINQIEDCYGQLSLEIREMVNAEESKIFDNQTIFYLSEFAAPLSLGRLFHLRCVTLSNEQIQFLR